MPKNVYNKEALTRNKDTKFGNSFSLLISSDYFRLYSPCAHSCRALRTQLWTSTLGLWALNCRACTYATNRNLDLFSYLQDFIYNSWLLKNSLELTYLAIFIQSHGLQTIGRYLQLTLLYKIKGRKPFMTLDTFTLCDHKMWRLYNFTTKFNPKHGLLAPKLSLGDLVPNRAPTQTLWLAL